MGKVGAGYIAPHFQRYQMSKWRELAKAALAAAKVPMSAPEIWAYAQQHGLAFPTNGKTPDASIAAQLYVDMKEHGPASEFVKAGKKPAKFALAENIAVPDLPVSIEAKKVVEKPAKAAKITVPSPELPKASERDLHAVLAAYANFEPHFKALVRTIYHEESKQKTKGMNEWLHPDIIGVYFPFRAYEKETLHLQKELAVNAVKFFSFELKLKLDFSNLRESFFQAVSNSSWANEGYLVAGQIADGADLKDELRRLSNAFGIGVIRLNCQNVQSSEILFPAINRPQLDWATVNRLTKENRKMKVLLENVTSSVKISREVGDYDEVMSNEQLQKHVKDKYLS